MISQLGRYKVLDELGQGAMGTVYKAVDPLIDRVVALKTINLSLALDEKEEYEARFYQEAKAAGRLSHPNIVTIFDVGKSDDVAYIAMEYLKGRELRDIMNEEGGLSVNQVLDIVIQVAQGLEYAHEHDIVHRDVKPSNIMVIRNEHIKITDFGIARMASSAVLTQTGMVLGSPKYMSPEQVMGKKLDQRTDIFSLGVMLYEMLTQQAPFIGENVNAIMYQTLNGVPPPPNTLNKSAPEMVNFIVAKALAKELEDRYQNAKDFVNDLRACRDTLPRSGQRIDLSKPIAGGEKKLPNSLDVSGSWRANEEEGKAISTLGLSKSFDSSDATSRLAALTADGEIADEFAKTLKVEKPSKEALERTVPVGQVARVKPSLKKNTVLSARKPGGNNGLLIVIVLLVLLGLAAIVLI